MTLPVEENDLRAQYTRAVDEYRFQVDLNWRRSEYFFVLNIGVLIASATMFSSDDVPRELVAVLFLVGALLAVLSILANDAQRGYYHSARNLKRKLEEQLGLGKIALATTPGMGSPISRLGRVGTFLKIMLVAIALADLVGAAFALDSVVASSWDSDTRQISVQIEKAGGGVADWSAIVVSQDGDPIHARRLEHSQSHVLFDLEPGRYLVWVSGASICRHAMQVTVEPLQIAILRC